MRYIAPIVCAALLLGGCGGDTKTAEPEPAPIVTETAPTTPEPEPTTESKPTPKPTAKPKPQPKRIEIVVTGGVPKDGIVRATVPKAKQVVLVVRSDVAGEVHLHGYDVKRDVAAGGTARLPFVADLAGRFEVELEERHVLLAQVTVR